MADPTAEFLRQSFAAIGADVRTSADGIWHIALPASAAEHFDDRAELALTFDRETYRTSEEDIELVVPGSPLFASVLAALGPAGAASAVSFDAPPDPARAQGAARAGITLRNGALTPQPPRIEPFRGLAILFRMRVEGPEREDALVAAVVAPDGAAFEVPAAVLQRLATEGTPVALPAFLPGDRNKLRDAAAAVALREAQRRATAAEAKSAGRMAKEIQQVRGYFEALGAELKEKKAEGRGDDAKKEAASRLRNLERERDLRITEVQDRFRAHGAVEPVAALVISGSAARVTVQFQSGARRVEREALWFAPLDRANPPVCDACGGALGEASICGEPTHDALLCNRCRRYCQACGVGLCHEHSRACACGAVACSVHGVACEACGAFACGQHSTKCVRCCRPFCRQHSFACGVCACSSCSEHSRRCGSCDIELCGEHQSMCDVTGKCACPTHAKKCETCGETVLDIALKEGHCECCRTPGPVAPDDPAVAAAEAYLPDSKGAEWRRAETKTRIQLTGSTWMSRFRVWLGKDLKPLSAWGGAKLFGMKKLKG